MEETTKYYTVTQYNKAIKNFLEEKEPCRHVHIKGEISNFKLHTAGHMYFSLKDETSRIKAVMFKYQTDTLDFVPKDGDSVLIDGKISVYETTGEYQVYADKMILDGNGDLLKKLEELKKKLEHEGLFNASNKKPIPKYPSKIGIVTAPTGAAIRDILSTIKRRYPVCETILFPALVQGQGAKESIAKQIELAQNYDIDVLIVGRGGGSIEDLWAFNEEIVARAIFNSNIPVISAVGHEIDFTIADFVSDMRAPTPTGAAEMAVPDMRDLISYFDGLKERLSRYLKNNIDDNTEKLDALIEDLLNAENNIITNSKKELTNILEKRILKNPQDMFIKFDNSLTLLISKLELLNPLNILKKGYSVISNEKGIINSITKVKENDSLSLKLIDGTISATANEIIKEVK